MERKIRPLRSLLSLALACLMLSPLSHNVRGLVYRKGNTNEKKIAITFDDGPSKRNTKEILALLEKYNVKATFFVIGENAEKDPDRIRSIFEAGHEIGNHTYTHAYISKISKEALKNEITKTEEVLVGITGVKPHVFRPPGGYYDDASLAILDEMGYKSVLWSLDTRDWSMPKSDTIATKVEERTGGGDIILFHDLEDKRLPTVQALRRILPFLIENGYEFVTISELLENEAD